MARMMALCSLPRTNPGNRKEYKRVNGHFTLYMIAGGGSKLPFGNLPRLILAWLSTEAVRTQSRELVLGRSLSDFMRALGVYSSSGGVQTRLRNQMNRLFSATVQLIYEDESGFAQVTSPVADKHEFWWNTRKPNEASLWDSKIELSEKFFQEITTPCRWTWGLSQSSAPALSVDCSRLTRSRTPPLSPLSKSFQVPASRLIFKEPFRP